MNLIWLSDLQSWKVTRAWQLSTRSTLLPGTTRHQEHIGNSAVNNSRGPIACSPQYSAKLIAKQLNFGWPSHPTFNVPPLRTMVTITETATATTPPTADWQLAHQHAQQRITRLQELRSREASSQSRIGSFFGGQNGTEGLRPAFRVGQLDTELLDEELLELMKGQLWNGLKYFRVCGPHPHLPPPQPSVIRIRREMRLANV